MDSKHYVCMDLGARVGIAIAGDRGESVLEGVCLYYSLYYHCSSIDLSLLELLFTFFPRLPLPIYLYIHYSRSISNRYGSLLSAVEA